jgi:competence protein ComEA
MKKWLFALFAMLVSVAALAAVNVNTASQQELETLKGIGPVKAKAIIDYRSKNGPFKTPADLVNVPGIGEKTVEKLKADLAFGGAAAPAAAKPAAPAPAPAPAAKKP